MPYAGKRICNKPGCNELSVERGYCAPHSQQRQAEYEEHRGSASSRGYDRNWRRLRAMFLRAHPLCVDPYHDHQGRVVVATEVDHIVPKSKGGGNEFKNLQSLCKECHSRKTAREDGRWGIKNAA